MQKVQFFNLERSIQDRFVASSHGREVPSPLLFERAKPNPKVAWLLILSAALLLGLGVFAAIGFGKLGHPMAQSPLWTLGIYAGVVGAAAITLFVAFRLSDKDESLPFRRGVFLYPVGVIDARSPEISVFELIGMSALHAEEHLLKLSFDRGQNFEFRVKDRAEGDAIVSRLTQSQSRASLPPGEHSQREGVLQNPLLDTGFPNPFGPTEPLRPPVLKHTSFWFVAVLAIGLLAGAGSFAARNHASVRNLYAKARVLDTTAAYAAFLKSGAKKSDVTDILLPRAELRSAVAIGSADAIEQFLDTHPNSKIESEGASALRTALLRELENARSERSLSALRRFRQGDPRVLLVETERQTAETVLYRDALAQFQAASTSVHEHADFFARLLQYTRKHGGRVELRFRRSVSDTVEKTESQVRKSVYYIGPPALPAQYFDAAHSTEREAKLAAVLMERFSSVFPKDMLVFQLGEPLADDGTDRPKVSCPTLLVTHRLDMSGPFTSTKPRGAFVGVGLSFKATFLIPEDNTPLLFQFRAWLPPNLRKFEDEHQSLPEMYGSMANDGFSRFLTKFLASLFKS